MTSKFRSLLFLGFLSAAMISGCGGAEAGERAWQAAELRHGHQIPDRAAASLVSLLVTLLALVAMRRQRSSP